MFLFTNNPRRKQFPPISGFPRSYFYYELIMYGVTTKRRGRGKPNVKMLIGSLRILGDSNRLYYSSSGATRSGAKEGDGNLFISVKTERNKSNETIECRVFPERHATRPTIDLRLSATTPIARYLHTFITSLYYPRLRCNVTRFFPDLVHVISVPLYWSICVNFRSFSRTNGLYSTHFLLFQALESRLT